MQTPQRTMGTARPARIRQISFWAASWEGFRARTFFSWVKASPYCPLFTSSSVKSKWASNICGLKRVAARKEAAALHGSFAREEPVQPGERRLLHVAVEDARHVPQPRETLPEE